MPTLQQNNYQILPREYQLIYNDSCWHDYQGYDQDIICILRRQYPFFLYEDADHTYCNNAIKFVDEFGIKKYDYLKDERIKKQSNHYKLYKNDKLVYDFNRNIEYKEALNEFNNIALMKNRKEINSAELIINNNIYTKNELSSFYDIFMNMRIEHFKLERLSCLLDNDILILVIFECNNLELYNEIKLLFENSNFIKLGYELRANMRWAFYKIVII